MLTENICEVGNATACFPSQSTLDLCFDRAQGPYLAGDDRSNLRPVSRREPKNSRDANLGVCGVHVSVCNVFWARRLLSAWCQSGGSTIPPVRIFWGVNRTTDSLALAETRSCVFGAFAGQTLSSVVRQYIGTLVWERKCTHNDDGDDDGAHRVRADN